MYLNQVLAYAMAPHIMIPVVSEYRLHAIGIDEDCRSDY